MQQATPMITPTPPPLSTITTEQIQKYLDENKQLILAILENQNMGKLSECVQYQALLQKNLLFLAAIADAQPQNPAARPPTVGPGMMAPGVQYVPQSQAFSAVGTVQLNPQLMSEQRHLHQHPEMLHFPPQQAMRPAMTTANGMQVNHQPSRGSLAGKCDTATVGSDVAFTPENKRLENDSSGVDANIADKS